MTDTPRLIERAFPLKQTSLTSVHEKNVRHGHISTLHIWPARRPLAACRAALLATLLPDPGTADERRKLCERIGGTVVEKSERKKMPNGRIVERIKEETKGGVLSWIGTEPKSGGGKKKMEQYQADIAFRESELAWFREEIKKAYGGRAPRVLDPFAGGGAIPLEAMRLGCEATAVDINPVAWFILKCTLEYPQKLAGKTYPLPDFVLNDEDFMMAFFTQAKSYSKAAAKSACSKYKGKNEKNKTFVQITFGSGENDIQANLAWHVRAWGRWVLNQARKELAPFYPTYADFEPLDHRSPKLYEKEPMRLLPLKEDGTPDIDSLNAEFSEGYLADKSNPRWVAKPTVAYLWARTVKCKNCRAIVPLLKTRWLCKKDRKRVLLTMALKADKSGVEFGIHDDVPTNGGNSAQKREHDKRIGEGTMSRAGAKCPCCGTIMMLEDIRIEGLNGRLGAVNTANIVEGQQTKEYRLPTMHEEKQAEPYGGNLPSFFEDIPFGLPVEQTPNGGVGASRAFSIRGYGLDKWHKVFSQRQLIALAGFSKTIRGVFSKDEILSINLEAVVAYLSCALSRLADRNSVLCTWQTGAEKIGHTFARYALPITWDFVEVSPWAESSGGFGQAVAWVAQVVEHCMQCNCIAPKPNVKKGSAIIKSEDAFDVVITDPPYYDAIPYSDCMDFFYIWLRRTLFGSAAIFSSGFNDPLSPKWKNKECDGEIIDDAGRHDGDSIKSKIIYEEAMAKAFQTCHASLVAEGLMIVVFAHKHPNAWETLVGAIIKAGFVVNGSWPIQTERTGRMRAMSSAALSSSVWLVCKKRPIIARPGWDNRVIEEMRANIAERLREYWDAGIRGPDFVWAATGPGLEAYSKHPIVKKANTPGEVLSVSEFLSLVRRMVVDFVVGQVLSGTKEGPDMAVADRMDAPTAYYLLHRHDFGMDEAPAGACILYATACGLSDRDLESAWDLVSHKGGGANVQDEDEEEDLDDETESEENGDSGSKIKLKPWAQRKRRSMGYEAPSGRPIPLIDRVHCLMHLWRAGDVHKVDEYLDDNGLRRQELFKRLVQSMIELSNGGSEERSILESLSNHVQAKGAKVSDAQKKLTFGNDDLQNKQER